MFFTPLKTFSLIRRRHHCRWKGYKLGILLGDYAWPLSNDIKTESLAVSQLLAFHWWQSYPETNFGSPMKSNRGKRMEITQHVGVSLHFSSLGVIQTRVNISYIFYICLTVRRLLFHLLAYFMFMFSGRTIISYTCTLSLFYLSHLAIVLTCV